MTKKTDRPRSRASPVLREAPHYPILGKALAPQCLLLSSEPTPKLPPPFQRAVPSARGPAPARRELPRPRTGPSQPRATRLRPRPEGPHPPLPAGTRVRAAPPAESPAFPEPGPLFPPGPTPAAPGSLNSHPPQILPSQRQKHSHSPLKSSSRKKSGRRAQSRTAGRRLSAMTRGAEGPQARGAARLPRAHAPCLPGPLLPAPSYHSDLLARHSRHHGDKGS